MSKVAGRLMIPALLLSLAWPAAAQQGETPEQQQIRQLETNWANALVKKDQYTLDLVLSPTYVDISGDGAVTTKNQQIAAMFAPGSPLVTYRETITSIRVLGDSAIAQGTYTMRRKAGGADDEEKGVFTHVYQRVRSSWQCINSQRTIVVERTVAPVKKQSKAELPFHVPFVGKKKPKDTQQTNPATVTDFAPDDSSTNGSGNAGAGANGETTNSTQPPADQSNNPQPQLESPK